MPRMQPNSASRDSDHLPASMRSLIFKNDDHKGKALSLGIALKSAAALTISALVLSACADQDAESSSAANDAALSAGAVTANDEAVRPSEPLSPEPVIDHTPNGEHGLEVNVRFSPRGEMNRPLGHRQP